MASAAAIAAAALAASTERKKKESGFDALGEERQATALRKRCEMHISEQPGIPLPESKETVLREDLVKRWAARRELWNTEKGGLTLAEIWFIGLCYQQMAMHPPQITLRAVDCIRLYEAMQNVCKSRVAGAASTAELFDQVAYFIVYVQSYGIDETINLASAQHFQAQPYGDWVRKKKQKLAKKHASEALAGKAGYGFVPYAARTFWHSWAEDMARTNTEEHKSDALRALEFDKWMAQQFQYQTQQSFRVYLTDLVYKHHVPMGGMTFHERGIGASQLDVVPAFALSQMELPEAEHKLLVESMDATVLQMHTLAGHPGREMAISHMFAYTFTNRMQKGDLVTPFDPYLVYKWQIPDRLEQLTGPLTQWGRPKRPVIVETQTGWFVHHVQCSCPEVKSTVEHRDGPRSCVLKRHVYRCANVTDAQRIWCELMISEFACTMSDSTSIGKLLHEIFSV